MNIHIMNNIGDLEISLLGFLIDKPIHGYDLHRRVADLKGFGIVWHLKIGKLYAMLNKLYEAKLVSVENTQEGNRPVRNEYSITDNGNKVLNEWLEKPVLHGRDFRHIFLLKLLFCLIRGKEASLNLIEAQQSECNTWKKRFEKRVASIESARTEEINFQDFVNRYRLTQIAADLNWLDWSAQKIREEK